MTKDHIRDEERPDPRDKDLSHIPAGDLAWPFPLPDPRREGVRRGREGKGEKPPTYSPWIEIDDANAATPPGVFWLSPDIWVTSSAGMNLPQQGEANQIFVRVHNRGLMDAGNVSVRFYVANPSAAITDQSVMPVGGTLAGATLTGVYIPAGGAVDLPCPAPWFPDPLTHQCLLAKAWCPGLDPVTAPLEPLLDVVASRHCAQRNVTVTLVTPASSWALTFEVANITGFGLPVELLVHEVPFDLVARRIKRLQIPLAHDLSQPWLRPEIDASLSEARWFQHHGPATFGRMLVAAEDKAMDRTPLRNPAKAVIRITQDLAPYERRKLTFRGWVPDDARPGEAFAYDITQVLGGVVTGGYSGLFIVDKKS